MDPRTSVVLEVDARAVDRARQAASLRAMQTALAHITATDVGFGLGLFFLGLALGAFLVARFRDVRRER